MADSDYDDLDDLDEYLDEFNDVLSKPPGSGKPTEAETTAIPQLNHSEKPSATSATTAKPQESSANSEPQKPIEDSPDSFDPEDMDPEAFAEQIQKGMDELFKEMESSPDAQKQLETLLREVSALGRGGETQGSKDGKTAETAGTSKEAETGKPAGLHSVISDTLNRMKESEQKIDSELEQEGSDNFLADLLQQLNLSQGGSGSGIGGENGDFNINELFADMLEQLSRKDILYEPIKELSDKFPAWLEANSAKLSVEERERYLLQQKLVDEMVAQYEAKDYSDTDKEKRAYISERLEKMQNAGAPPAELVGDAGIPGLDFNDSSLPDIPDNLDQQCTQA